MARPLVHSPRKFVFLVSATLLLAIAVTWAWRKFNESLGKGLEEEKSYTRHAMEYHREHPDQQRMGTDVLETWSKADYIAEAVEKHGNTGTWAEASDQLGFLPDGWKRENGKPFCIIQFPAMTMVLWPPSKPFDTCTIYLAPSPHDISDIKSGDMEFSGRTDAWVYVLKRSN